MPVVQRLMDNLTARYGKAEGERVYYAMEAEGRGPFGPRGKYRSAHEEWAKKHGVPPITGKKKAPAKKGRGRKG